MAPDFAHGLVVFRAQAAFAVGEHVAHDPHAVPHVIEHDEAEKKHHHRVVHAHVVARRVRNALDEPHHVIRKISDRARNQRRQARHAHRAIALHAVAQVIERIRLHPGHAALAFQHARAVDVAKHFARDSRPRTCTARFFLRPRRFPAGRHTARRARAADTRKPA